jgi:hypothetical protein
VQRQDRIVQYDDQPYVEYRLMRPEHRVYNSDVTLRVYTDTPYREYSWDRFDPYNDTVQARSARASYRREQRIAARQNVGHGYNYRWNQYGAFVSWW